MESTGINRLLLHLDSTHMRAAIKPILVWDYSSHPFFRVRLEEAIKRKGDKIFHFDWSYAIGLELTNLSDGDKRETDRTPHDFPPINLRLTFSLGDFCIPSTKHLFGSREWLVCCIKLRRDVFIATCTISATKSSAVVKVKIGFVIAGGSTEHLFGVAGWPENMLRDAFECESWCENQLQDSDEIRLAEATVGGEGNMARNVG